MTSYSMGARNKIVDSIAVNGGADWFSMHTADPGTTGANELAGSPRRNGPYPASTAGESTNSGTLHDIPLGSSFSYFGRWSAPTGGTYLAGGPLPAAEVYGVAGQYQLSNKIVQGAT
jgi:hypothetical protein